MKRRTLEEMITYFNQQVDQMDIDRKYKMALLGMITAIGYENKKQERTGRWIVSEPQGVWTNIYHCSECGGGVMSCKVDLPKFCGHCGAKMEEL